MFVLYLKLRAIWVWWEQKTLQVNKIPACFPPLTVSILFLYWSLPFPFLISTFHSLSLSILLSSLYLSFLPPSLSQPASRAAPAVAWEKTAVVSPEKTLSEEKTRGW